MAIEFDLPAARLDYSDDQILSGLKSRGLLNFDVDAARKDGYSATDILNSIYKPPAEQPKPEPSGFMRRVGDMGVSLARGVVALPEALTGIANIPTLGAAGRGLEAVGVDFKRAKDFLAEFYSPEQIAENKAVSGAKGFGDTIAASLENPSTILGTAVESLPQMLGGAAAARKIGATALGSGLSGITRGAIGEGAIAAGASAESIRQQTDDGYLTPFQSGAAATSGALTGLIGVVGGRIAKKLGIADVDTMLAGGATGVTTQSLARRIVGGGIAEGVFEELPQSAQEQIFQNAALNRPLLDGVEEAAAKGLLVGAAMGGVTNIRGARPQVPPSGADQSTDALLLENRPDPLISFPDGSVGTQSDFDSFIESLPESERVAQRARMMGLGAQEIAPEVAVADIVQAPDIDSALASATALLVQPTAAAAEKKNADIDSAWNEYNANKTAQREAEFQAAEAQRQAIEQQQLIDEVASQTVEQAEALTQAQGFDDPQQTAMQAAFERARRNRDTGPLSSLTGGRAQASGLRAADVSTAIESLTSKWKGFSGLRTVQSIADIPPEIAARLSADAQTEGFYDPKTNSVYLIADAISTPERAAFVAAHEVIGHGGLRMLQDKTVTTAVKFASGNKFIQQLATAIAQERGGTQSAMHAEEAIAELAAALETGDISGIESRYGVTIPESARTGIRGAVSRVIESVRRWFAGVIGVPIEEVSNREIYSMISAQMAAVSGMSTSGTASAEYQGEALQSRNPASQSIEDFADGIADKYGIKIRMYDDGQNINLSRIEVNQAGRGQGTGTKAMQEIIDYADQAGRTIVLSPSADFGGNVNRLTKFYKRLGFTENKGRGKDYAISEAMYREPQGAPQQSRAPGQQTMMVDGVARSTVNSDGRPIAPTPEAIANFWRWFGDSKVVDDQGRPLVAYHGSRQEFTVFDYGKIGEQGRSEGAGFYFTNNKNVASGYGSVMSVYLAIQKPMAYDAKPFSKPIIEKLIKRIAEIESNESGMDIADGFMSNFGDVSYNGLASVVREASKLITPENTALDQLSNILGSGANPEHINQAVREITGYDGVIAKGFSNVGDSQNTIYVAFFQNQIKSATDNSGEFSPENTSILQSRAPTTERVPKWAENYTDAQKEILRKTGAIYTEQTLKDKIAEMREGLGAKLQQGILDQYAPIKARLGDVPYMLARMSKASEQGLEAIMNYGRLVLDGGAINVDPSKPGLIEVLAKLNGEHEQFFQWVAGKRARELKAQGRENLLDDSDITFLADLNKGQMADGTSRAQAYTTAQLALSTLNNSVLDIAEESGIIDKESRKVFQSEFYVPFYRVIEEGVAGPTIKGGLINQQSIKRLKGGTNNLSDLMGNMQRNWATLLASSAKNRAAAAILPKAAEIGAATEVPEATARNMAKSASAKVASFRDEGVQRWYVMDDDALFSAISALEFNGYNNAAMRVMGGFKNLLTKLVTAAPGFKFFRNPVRDALSSIAVSNKLSWNPLANFKDGVTLLRDEDFRASMIAGGGMMRFGTYLDGNRADYLKGILNAKLDDQTMLNTPEKMKNFLGMLWDKYNAVGDYGENFNRAALYARERAAGKSHLEASFEARDLMDFGLSGAWAGVRALNQVLPFFNARLQGLYKLGRGYNDDPARVGAVIGTLALASIALLLAYKDDEDWKKRTDQDRNSNWWFKVGGVAYRIPKPFEVGAAATAIENLTALFVDSENTNAKRFAHQLGDIINAQLSINPIPQMVRPMIDVYANKDAFTGRPIESLAMQRLRPEDRYTYSTSELARLMSQSKLLFDPVSLVSGTGYKQLSPVQIDSIIKGYFTSAGVLASAAVDGLLRSTVIDRGERLPVALRTKSFGIAEDLPANSSRYVDILYDAAKKIDQSYASYREAIKLGDIDKARNIAAANPNLEGKYHFIARVKDAESKIGAQIKIIMNNKTMSGEEKQAKIRMLRQKQSEIAQKASVKLQ
jgi:hypothetical protein